LARDDERRRARRDDEQIAEREDSFSADRREDQGARRLAGTTLSKLRSLVRQADPDVVEERKWRGVPTWYHDGMICTAETYKSVVKMTFARGAALKDPSGKVKKRPSQQRLGAPSSMVL
jgi:hypothetical protein